MGSTIIDKINSYNRDLDQEKIGFAYDYVLSNKGDLDLDDLDLDNVLVYYSH